MSKYISAEDSWDLDRKAKGWSEFSRVKFTSDPNSQANNRLDYKKKKNYN